MAGNADPAVNDSFRSSVILSGIPATGNGTNVEATDEPGEPQAGSGENSIWWTWEAPDDGWVQIDTFGSAFDTVLAVYTGTSLSELFRVGVNDDAGEDSQSAVKLFVSASTRYKIQVLRIWRGDRRCEPHDRSDTSSFLANIEQPVSPALSRHLKWRASGHSGDRRRFEHLMDSAHLG